MTDEAKLQQLAAELRRLVESSPERREELTAWSAVAVQTCERLADAYPEVPIHHRLIHYVHDADIRLSDVAYRDAQTRAMQSMIADLDRGIAPSAGGTLRVPVRILVLLGCCAFILTAGLLRSCRQER